MTISLTGGNFQNNSLKAKILGPYCSTTVLPHLDASRVSGSLQICPESGHNNQIYALNQKGVSLWSKKVLLSNLGFWANFGKFWPDLASNVTQIWPKFDPNLTQISALYFQNWLFLPNLALRWPKFDPIWSIWLILSLMHAQVIYYWCDRRLPKVQGVTMSYD